MNTRKIFHGIVSILLAVTIISNNTEAALLSNVGVKIGDSFEYKYTELELTHSHNGTSYVNYLGADIVGKTINITVDDFYETVDESFLGFNYDRIQFNQTEKFDSNTNETHSFLDYWFDIYRYTELAFNTTSVNFDPEEYEFHPPSENAIYDYNIAIGISIFATTNVSFYENIEENGIPETGDSYVMMCREKDDTSNELTYSKEEQIAFVDNILTINVTNEDTQSGITVAEEDWSIHSITRYDLSINTTQGLVTRLLYEYSYEIVMGPQHSEMKTLVAFEEILPESTPTPTNTSLTIPLIALTSALVIAVLRRRKVL